MSEHDELRESVPAWVLGALDRDESERVRAHVETCDECQAEVARLRPVAESIGLASRTVAAPAGLRERIIARARREPDGTVSVDRQPLRLDVRRRLPPRARIRFPFPAVAAMVAVALLAGAVAGAVAGRLTPSQPPAAVAQYTLTGHDAMSGASAQVVELRSDRVTFVAFSHLPSPPEGKLYEIWLIKAGTPAVAAGVFVPEPDGTKTVLLARSIDGFATMAVTAEAAPNGAPAPTQQPQLYGSLG
jgi:anti-sigma-K factor RskA